MDERDLTLLATVMKVFALERTIDLQQKLDVGVMPGQLALHDRNLDQECYDAQVKVAEDLNKLNGRNPRIDGDRVEFMIEYPGFLEYPQQLKIYIKNQDRKWKDHPNINELISRMQEQIKEKWKLKPEDTVIGECSSYDWFLLITIMCA